MALHPVPAPPPEGAVTTRTCQLWLERGLLRGRFLRGAEVTREDALENLAVSMALTGGRRLPALIDLREVKAQTAEARTELAGPSAARVSGRVALLIGSPLSRVVGNFYLRFNRPETPTRLFSSEAEAETWLRGGPGASAVGADG
jgi:hypothetical protein